MADYWWSNLPNERYWIEIRKVPGAGADLHAGLLTKAGTTSGAYELLDDLSAGDVVYHWHATQSRFIGRSTVAGPRTIVGSDRVVSLRDFNPLIGDVTLENVRAHEQDIYKLRDSLKERFPDRTLYLPFQFRSDGIRMVSYYFAKLPQELVTMLFGASGWADEHAVPPPEDEGDADELVPVGAQRGYLQPFKPKADADYLAKTRQRVQKRSRKHEALVNAFTEWLTAHGYQSLRNRAIDIGLERPPVIIEAEVITSWSRAIREAVGQLYEYRFFQVVAPDSRLAFLASAPIPPEWVSYLEEDRGIATVWRDGEDFYFSKKAREAFELP